MHVHFCYRLRHERYKNYRQKKVDAQVWENNIQNRDTRTLWIRVGEVSVKWVFCVRATQPYIFGGGMNEISGSRLLGGYCGYIMLTETGLPKIKMKT